MGKFRHKIKQGPRYKNPVQRGIYSGMAYSSTQLVKEIYSAFAITLFEDYGLDKESIETLFYNTQLVWNKCVQSDVNMVQLAKERTGIDVFYG